MISLLHLVMKRRILCWLWLLCIPLGGNGADQLDPFFQGNIALKEGRAAEAVDLFRKASSQQTSAALEFNLGHAYLQLDQPALALLHWYRAALLDPRNLDVAANIEWLLREQQWQPFPDNRLRGWFAPFSHSVYRALTSIFFLMALACWLLPRALKRSNVVTRTASGIGFVLALVAAVGVWSTRVDTNLGLVIADNITLRVAPTSQAPGQASLQAGTHIQFLGTERNFHLVRTASGQTGYLKDHEVEALLP